MKSTDKSSDTQPCGRFAGTGIEYADKYEDGKVIGRAAVQCSDCEGTGLESVF